MTVQVTLVTTDGRIITGLNYSISPSNMPSNVPGLVAGMPGQMELGTFHLQTPSGWQYVPASQIAAITRFQSGAPT